MFVELPTDNVPDHSKMLNQLSKFVPYVNVQQRLTESIDQSNCGICGSKIDLFTWVNYRCYYCKRALCKNCPAKVVLISRADDRCGLDDWTNMSVQQIEIGTLESIKVALGCLTIAPCLSNFSTKPVVR